MSHHHQSSEEDEKSPLVSSEAALLTSLFLALLAVFLLPQIQAYAHAYFAEYTIAFFYLCTLAIRYHQHAPEGKPLYWDPDVIISCWLFVRGRCCSPQDIICKRERIGKEWSLTEDYDDLRKRRYSPRKARVRFVCPEDDLYVEM